MLNKDLPQKTFQYLNTVLGSDAVRVTPGVKSTELPYFIQDTYEVLPALLLGQPVTFACSKSHLPPAAKQIELHTKRLGELLKTPVIVALPEVTPGERKQLIQHDIAFVVPGRQLFAPRLGMILSERYTAEPRRELELASPATQALLMWFLNHHPTTYTWHPFEVAAALGYAGMTATRAVRELLQFKLFELEERGRAKHLKLAVTRRELWEKAKSHLRSPVQKTLWTYDRHILDLPDARLGGESALAKLTMLNEPQHPVIALTGESVLQAEQAGVFFEPRELADAISVQVWRYIPNIREKEKTVDPLSLWLSLKDNRDDRVQIALDEMEEKFLW